MIPAAPWKILIVDDAQEVLTVTHLALEDFQYRGQPIDILDASSRHEAQEVLLRHPDIAVAVIDVIMETHHAGLDLVRWIREVQGNSLIRLIIRTGQAGEFPAHDVIVQYEINDYWEKTDVTLRKLQTSLLTCLRGYSDLLLLHQRTLQLETWADGLPDLLVRRDWTDLLEVIMQRLRGLFPERLLQAFVCRNEGARWPMSSGTGPFPAEGAPDVLPWLDQARARLLLDAWDQHSLAESEDAMALYFHATNGEAWLFFVSLGSPWTDYERHVTRMVLQNFRTLVDNRSLITELEHHRVELDAALVETDGSLSDARRRFQSHLQVLLSLMDIEAAEPRLVSGRTVLQGVRRRLQILSTVQELLLATGRAQSVDFREWLAVFAESEKRLSSRGATVETWGVPVVVEATRALNLALVVMELVDLTWAVDYRSQGPVSAQIRIADGPRRVELTTSGVQFPVGTPPERRPVEWQVLARLEAQLGGRLDVRATSVTLTF